MSSRESCRYGGKRPQPSPCGRLPRPSCQALTLRLRPFAPPDQSQSRPDRRTKSPSKPFNGQDHQAPKYTSNHSPLAPRALTLSNLRSSQPLCASWSAPTSNRLLPVHIVVVGQLLPFSNIPSCAYPDVTAYHLRVAVGFAGMIEEPSDVAVASSVPHPSAIDPKTPNLALL